MIHREEHIVNLISDDEDIPRVLPKHKGKGKARAPNLDDVIDLSDWMYIIVPFLGKTGFSISENFSRHLIVVCIQLAGNFR